MLNSVFVTALALVILLIVALSAAYCLSRFKFKGSKFLNAAFMGGLFINVNYIVVPIFLMLRDGDNWLKSVILFNFLSFWNDCWWFKGLMRREIKMEFWKKHTKCRIILMAALFIAGISLSVFGWGMTGKMTGLGIMLIGIICLLIALWIYNCPFAEKKKRK